MSLPPSEIPLGAMRFNSDSQKLEYWNGSAWMQIQTFSPNLDSGVRGIYGTGGDFPATTNTLEFLTISSQGNGTDFGDLTSARFGAATPCSSTRACFGGGSVGAPSYAHPNTIDFVTFSSTGNAIDFGDQQHGYNGYGRGNMSSGTRGFFYGDRSEATIDYITIATTGNAQDFGDTTESGEGYLACASDTRGIFVGGNTSPANINTIQYITIATTGNATDFGDIGSGRVTAQSGAGTSNNLRGVTMGGFNNPNQYSTTMEYVNIATTGNSFDFGYLSSSRAYTGSCSDSHGGLS